MSIRQMTRRRFLQYTSAGTAAALALPHLAFGASRREGRAKLAHRPRRIIFNDDGDDVWNAAAATPEGFVRVRLKHMLDTQADTLFYCTTQSFNYFTHNTQVGEIFLKQEGSFQHNNMHALLDQGTDPLKLAVAFAHEHGVEAIWTLRMNDIHDAFTPPLWPQWKTDHPDALLGTSEDWGKSTSGEQRRWWSGVNFYRDDVRKRTVELIEEVARNYDVDGIDLDWLRHPIHFPETFEGKPVKPEGVALITQLVRDTRKAVDAVGAERGRPILLATRVALTVKDGLYMGTDIETWLKEQLVDFVTTGGGYMPFSMPVAEIAQLAGPCGVPVYPCISNSGMMRRKPFGPGSTYSIEAWRATAANAFRNGADGISLFNLFPAPGQDAHNRFVRQAFNELGDPATLAGKDKLFCLDNTAHLDGCGYINHVVPYDACLPKPLDANNRLRVTVPVSDDASNAVAVQLRVQLDVDVPVTAWLNGQEVPLEPSAELNERFGMTWSTGAVDTKTVKQGANALEAQLTPKIAGAIAPIESESTVRLVGAEILVQYA